MIEFEEWYGQHIFLPESGGSIRDRLTSAFLAGQASAIAPVGFQRSDVIALQECVDELQAKCAELERDLKMTDEFRIKALNDLATIKAQASDPDQIDFWKNATDNAMKMISERNKTIEELTAQEPIACMVKGRLLSYKDSKVPNDCLLYLHPTTERPYNPLNDYAVIPMNPTTEPVKAQAGEPFGYWFAREGRFATLDECDRYFDADERSELLTPLFTHPTTEPVKAQAGEREQALKVADEGREYANELLQIAAVDITNLKKSIDKVSKRSRERAEKITTLEADAARYRWLRDKAIYVDPEQKILRICNVYIKDQISPMTLEAAVDAAIEKTK